MQLETPALSMLTCWLNLVVLQASYAPSERQPPVLLSLMWPPCSASNVRSLAFKIPSAAARITAALTGVPAFLSAWTNFWTSVSSSPNVIGLPRFLAGMHFTPAFGATFRASMYLLLKRRTLLSFRSISFPNCFNAALLPFSAAYSPILALCLSVKVVWPYAFDHDRRFWLHPRSLAAQLYSLQ